MITADEIRRAFDLPPSAELTFQVPPPPAEHYWVPEVWPIGTIAVGGGDPQLAAVESDLTYICG
jgi:hypothetical protein